MRDPDSRRADLLLAGIIGVVAGELAVGIAAMLAPKIKRISSMMAGKG